MKIGIGCAKDIDTIAKSITETSIAGEIYCYTTPELASTLNQSLPVITSEKPEITLINDLKNGKLDAAIRGTLPANSTLSYLKTAYNCTSLRRLAFLETHTGKKFLLAPVGIDEGWTVEDKISFLTESKPYLKAFGLPETAVVLAGGRIGDIGRHPLVDKSILDAKEICTRTGAKFGEILIEDAIATDTGLIIAPDGISGNLIFRTLVLLGGGYGHGAPIINISDIFIDSSRAMKNYQTILISTAHLVSLKRRKN